VCRNPSNPANTHIPLGIISGAQGVTFRWKSTDSSTGRMSEKKLIAQPGESAPDFAGKVDIGFGGFTTMATAK
jgi:hypothetical protein